MKATRRKPYVTTPPALSFYPTPKIEQKKTAVGLQTENILTTILVSSVNDENLRGATESPRTRPNGRSVHRDFFVLKVKKSLFHRVFFTFKSEKVKGEKGGLVENFLKKTSCGWSGTTGLPISAIFLRLRTIFLHLLLDNLIMRVRLFLGSFIFSLAIVTIKLPLRRGGG